MKVYNKSTNIAEAASFARKHFSVKHFSVCDVSCANTLNAVLTKIHNATKGEARFPPMISIIKRKNCHYNGNCGITYMEVIKTRVLAKTIAHEIGHYNHQIYSKNFIKMGKHNELIERWVKDHSFYERFSKDKKSLKLIKKYICPYATSSPAEFVACTFNCLINGKKLPPEILKLYEKYEGPFADLFSAQLK